MRKNTPLPIAGVSLALRARPRRTWPVLLALLVTCASAAPARAGVELVSRQSFIHAAGGPNGFDLANGTSDFERFADDVSNAPSGQPAGSLPVLSEAHQYSMPGVSDGGLQGAFAEGSVRSGVSSPAATASATSNFDLTFRVTGAAVGYTFGAAMGTTGTATVFAELVDLAAGENVAAGTAGVSNLTAAAADVPVFVAQLAANTDDARNVDKTGTLQPGLYALRVHADSTGTADESSAYYNLNLLLTPAAGPTAVPLPPGAWTGLMGLAGLFGTNVLYRRGGRAMPG